MADSPTAQHRARLIREMARELKRPSQSASNQIATDGSSVWDPEHEGFTSTSFGDTTNTTQRLPTLRDSAKKYRTYTRPQEPDFEINTSMMAKAFPDFSQGAIISDDAGSSLEMGRADNGPPTTTSNTSGDYRLRGEHQRRHISTSKKTARAGSEDLRKEAMVRRASDSPKPHDTSYMSTSKVEDHGSEGSRNNSAHYRRPLTDSQARIWVDDDASQLSENKSENLTLNVRRTRFGGRKNQQDHTTSDVAPNENNTGHDYHESTRDDSTAGRFKSTTSRPASDNVPNKSMPRAFLFPNTRDTSSVLSVGQLDTGHVLPRQRKARPSRFASGEESCNASDIQRVYTPVEEVVAQDDEQAIIQALNQLYDRVTTLESNEDSIKQTVAELKSENVMLRADMVGQDKRRPSNGITATANELVQSLRKRLDSVEGKATAAEDTIKALTKERDGANFQVSLVSETAEGLLDKIQLLEKQRDDFKRRWLDAQKQCEESETTEALLDKVQLLEDQRNDFKRKWVELQEQHEKCEITEGLRDKIQLLEEQRDDFERKWVALQKQYEEEALQWKPKQEPKNDILPRSGSGSASKRVGNLDLFDNSFRFVSGKSGPIRSTSDIRHSEGVQNAYEIPVEDHESEEDNSTVLHHVVEEDNSLPQAVSIGKVEDNEPKAPQQTPGIPQELTQVTNVDTNNLVVLRKDLEGVRITRPKQPVITVEHCGQEDAANTAVSVDAPLAADASREPSARVSSGTPINEKTERPNQPSVHFNYIRREEILQKVAESKAKWATSSKPSSGSFLTQQTDDSQLSRGTVIRRRPSEHLTSAFLIPDITFEKVPVPSAEETPEPPKQAALSPLVRQLVVSLSNHPTESCPTCKRILHPDGCDFCRSKQAKRVSKATSVSVSNKATSPIKFGRTSRSSQSLISSNSSYDTEKQPLHEANLIALSEQERQTHHDDHGATHRSSRSPINTHTSHHAAQPQPTEAAKPAPDAESMSESSQYEDQPTMRPSQHPGVALATVMKGLKAELREIKRELALRQKAYTRQDPTLGKRRRHQLREAVEALVRSAETQADRIYALQDVLEGQKAAGQAMSPEELEETLQSIGIDCDVSALSLGEN